MYQRALTPEQIQEGRRLRINQGYTKRELAEYFGISHTTVWDNIFAKQPPWKVKKRANSLRKADRIPTFRELRCVILVVTDLKRQGHVSRDVAHSLQLPLAEVNYIYARHA